MKIGPTFISSIVVVVVFSTTLVILTSGQTTKRPSHSSAGIVGQRNKKNNGRNGRPSKVQRKRGNGNARSGCEEIYLPMCKGLVPYTHTKLPNQFNHTTQLEVYKQLSHLWAYMDHSCSKNTRVLICSTYLPKCHGRQPAQGPCKKTCMLAKKKCAKPLKDLMNFNWDVTLECKGLPSKNCVKPVKETKCPYEYTHCMENSVISVCANLTFAFGTLPNMFGQCNIDELNAEIQQFNMLLTTNCHLNLKFLLCGIFSPFCVRNEVPFSLPCREICEEIRQSCEPHYKRLYHDLPWPQKLQCHRYPTSENTDIECVMPNEGSTFFG